MTVDVIIEENAWANIGFEVLARTTSDATLKYLGLDPDAWDISVLACNDDRIAALNANFRGKPQSTNVLSWPSEERRGEPGQKPSPPSGDPELGDIAIAYETCMKEAKSGNKPSENHVKHLIIHGVLHLLGYDHDCDDDADLMEGTEIAILERLGVPNPYIGGV